MKEPVVISPLSDWTCRECQGSGELLVMEGPGPLCLACAELDHLVFLGRGDAAVTRWRVLPWDANDTRAVRCSGQTGRRISVPFMHSNAKCQGHLAAIDLPLRAVALSRSELGAGGIKQTSRAAAHGVLQGEQGRPMAWRQSRRLHRRHKTRTSATR